MIFDGILKLLVELGMVRKGKQRLDSTHIVGYVKAMSYLECAMETLRLAVEDLEHEVGKKKRPEFWDRLWELYVQSKLDWRLSKTEHDRRYRQCGQHMRELLEWLDRNDSKLREREAVKLLRRVFEEHFEVVEGKLEPATKRPPRAVQNRMIPMRIMPIRGPSSGPATRCMWRRASIHNNPSRKKASPPSILLPRY